ncbi:hypothetical protein EWM64_g8678 [Hericium alpestre]|uniref:Uncharacterized protein n=1 Tax=Hericium alpestre TaxID=135208 RepID=A0A4Y9ZM32_9AGAM|nr:hypothetical protein EWM64_g8678 [Hericium alpestre]
MYPSSLIALLALWCWAPVYALPQIFHRRSDGLQQNVCTSNVTLPSVAAANVSQIQPAAAIVISELSLTVYIHMQAGSRGPDGESFDIVCIWHASDKLRHE